MRWLKIFLLSSPLFICAFGLFGLSENTSALWIGDFGIRVESVENSECSTPVYSESHSYGQLISGCAVDTIVPISQQVKSEGDTVVYSGKLNLVKDITGNNQAGFDRFAQIGVRSVYFGSNELYLSQEPTVNYWVTRWTGVVDNINHTFETLTIQWAITGYNANINGVTDRLRLSFYNSHLTNERFDYLANPVRNLKYYFENTDEPLTVYFIDTGSGGTNTIINQNDIIINQNQQSINQQQATNDWLTDDTAPSADTSGLGNAAGWLPAGPLDSILNLPIQFIQGIVGVFTGTHTCQPITIPIPWVNYNLEIPCMRPLFEEAGWSYIWNGVGTIISAVLIFHTFSWLYKFVEKTLSMRENDSEVWGGL